jgi:hypothetical protein
MRRGLEDLRRDPEVLARNHWVEPRDHWVVRHFRRFARKDPDELCLFPSVVRRGEASVPRDLHVR